MKAKYSPEKMTDIEYKLRDRVRGSLIGGAIGDALGYPVEFINSYTKIQQRYGERGITRLDIEQESGKALISDDTQMTLFTANGLLNAPRLGIDPRYTICRAYLEWLETQYGKHKGKAECWVRDVPELNHHRAPGNTCISALDAIRKGRDPMNHSKGCGGVMRIAPIPLYAASNFGMNIYEADRLAGEVAAITHQHPLGYIPAALMAHIIFRLLQEDEEPARSAMEIHIKEGMLIVKDLYRKEYEDLYRMEELTKKAVLLSSNEDSDLENIKQIGEGWTGEEALGIALYCSLKYLNNFEEAMIAAVNHGGDSDSTGAITGNILGAAIGYDAIPDFYKKDLEMHDLILHMADDIYRGEVTKF